MVQTTTASGKPVTDDIEDDYVDDADDPKLLLRGQALMMVANWESENESKHAGGRHPLDVVEQLHLSDRTKSSGRKKKATDSDRQLVDRTAHGTESRKSTRSAVRIKSLSAEARRTDAILTHIEKVDRRYCEALQLYSRDIAVRDVAAHMRRSNSDAGRFIEGGVGIFISCLILGVPA